MKKIILAVMAVAAIGFTSCGNKTQQGEAVDSVAIVDSMATAIANDDIAGIKALLESGDAAKLQECMAALKEKIANLIKENPEVAKEYVAKVQNFLKENADKVKSVVGDNAAVAAAVSAITDVEPENIVNGLLQSAGDKATEAKDAAVDAANQKVEEAKEAVKEAAQAQVDAAKQKAEDAKAAAKQKASDAVDNAANNAKKALGL